MIFTSEKEFFENVGEQETKRYLHQMKHFLIKLELKKQKDISMKVTNLYAIIKN